MATATALVLQEWATPQTKGSVFIVFPRFEHHDEYDEYVNDNNFSLSTILSILWP